METECRRAPIRLKAEKENGVAVVPVPAGVNVPSPDAIKLAFEPAVRGNRHRAGMHAKELECNEVCLFGDEPNMYIERNDSVPVAGAVTKTKANAIGIERNPWFGYPLRQGALGRVLPQEVFFQVAVDLLFGETGVPFFVEDAIDQTRELGDKFSG